MRKIEIGRFFDVYPNSKIKTCQPFFMSWSGVAEVHPLKWTSQLLRMNSSWSTSRFQARGRMYRDVPTPMDGVGRLLADRSPVSQRTSVWFLPVYRASRGYATSALAARHWPQGQADRSSTQALSCRISAGRQWGASQPPGTSARLPICCPLEISDKKPKAHRDPAQICNGGHCATHLPSDPRGADIRPQHCSPQGSALFHFWFLRRRQGLLCSRAGG